MNIPLDAEQAELDRLSGIFITALSAKEQGKFDAAEELLRDILRSEPRLAEPHMELARILLDTDRLKPAESEAREALDQLSATGPWLDEIPGATVHAIAHALLAEVLRRRADEDEVIFGDPEVFTGLLDEARKHFDLARKLDPSDEYASFHAVFLGPKSTDVN
ncbi:MAG: tetratricopeptide (TPR) repeat protein [Myxococcota bacterium]|jgi:tetratricopeptide (TPR) repeat protein